MQTKSIHTQSIPYWTVIPGGSEPGTKITIEGMPTRNCRRFAVNFVVGEIVDHFVDENDIAFHYNPRFDHKCIVRNTRIKKWGEEEWPPHRMPFMKNVKFTLVITIDEKCYKTVVNNSHFIDYNHRIPHDKANLFNINGDVLIDRIKFESPVVQVECKRDSVPRIIFSESEGKYMSCVEPVPFEFESDQDLESETSNV